ncbi:MAG: ATP-binding protein [Rhizobiaceae bacterium]
MPGEYPPAAGHAATGGRSDSAPGWSRRTWRASAAVAALTTASPAAAQSVGAFSASLSVGTLEVMQLAIFAGVTGSALLSAVWLIRERARIAAENVGLRSRVADLGAALARAEALVNIRDQRIVAWADNGVKAEIVGVLPRETGAPEDRGSFLAFGRWLSPRSAAALEQAVSTLRDKGEAFDVIVETQTGSPVEAQGRKTPHIAFVRFVSLSEAQRGHARVSLRNQTLAADQETLLALLDALEMPFWLREADGRLKWVNRAYAVAVEAADPATAMAAGREFLGTQARETIASQHGRDPVFEQTLSTVIAGDRRMFRVTDVASAGGSAGIATDVSAIEAVKGELDRTMRSHADTLDQLSTAVASFDADQKLRFFNQAFAKLWELDPAFLASAPENALLLDRLRSDGKLAEQPEWRRWKENLLAVYRAVETLEQLWHLPDGRTLRVVANPQTQGGVTWVFENLTERFDLESRYKTAVRVQGETLDNLAEGVAVFGPDGRVRLSNPAFAGLWGIEAAAASQGTHISAIRAACDPRAVDRPWTGFVAAVTGFDEERRDRHGQVELVDGAVLRYAVIHLPNGQVMITFVDVTDSVNVERALKDKNDALERADQLKNEFVQHVSYELRSPLTNIIGFTDLLALPDTGPLTKRQREYVEHVGSSSSVLLMIVNDILDLATVDAGIMELDIGEVAVKQAIDDAVELIADRLREHHIELSVDTARAPASFAADSSRVRQILFNLLSNAANFAPEGGTIQLTCSLEGESVVFTVHDDGPGMPPEVLDTVFRRFEPRPNGGRRRGAGLGLSLVKGFVELHGGSVSIESSRETGTSVICRFPLTPTAGVREAAE